MLSVWVITIAGDYVGGTPEFNSFDKKAWPEERGMYTFQCQGSASKHSGIREDKNELVHLISFLLKSQKQQCKTRHRLHMSG